LNGQTARAGRDERTDGSVVDTSMRIGDRSRRINLRNGPGGSNGIFTFAGAMTPGRGMPAASAGPPPGVARPRCPAPVARPIASVPRAGPRRRKPSPQYPRPAHRAPQVI